jgi:ribosomal protein S18 acetylase RimI-like enzyme
MFIHWSKNMLAFRYIQPDDFIQLSTLINRAYRPESGSEEGWTHESHWISQNRINVEQLEQHAHKDSQHIIIAELDDRIAGCVMFSLNQSQSQSQSYVEIGLLTVDPSVQNQQLGRKLLAQAEFLAMTRYQPDYFEMSVVNTRTELIEFYERRGYKLTDEIKPYPIEQGVGTPKMPLDMLPLHLVKMKKPV